jgi:hypothetical protein
MKIRIKGNSLRYRLSKSDITELKTNGYLEERADFLTTPLTCAIIIIDDDKLTADFVNNAIMVAMPLQMINDLEDTDQVGIEDITGRIHLMIEKDFNYADYHEEGNCNFYPDLHIFLPN